MITYRHIVALTAGLLVSIVIAPTLGFAAPDPCYYQLRQQSAAERIMLSARSYVEKEQIRLQRLQDTISYRLSSLQFSVQQAQANAAIASNIASPAATGCFGRNAFGYGRYRCYGGAARNAAISGSFSGPKRTRATKKMTMSSVKLTPNIRIVIGVLAERTGFVTRYVSGLSIDNGSSTALDATYDSRKRYAVAVLRRSIRPSVLQTKAEWPSR